MTVMSLRAMTRGPGAVDWQLWGDGLRNETVQRGRGDSRV